MMTLPQVVGQQSRRMVIVTGRRGARWFGEAARSIYRDDPNWTAPLPGEEEEAFAPRGARSPREAKSERWVLLDGERPIGRIAAFLPARHPGIGYFGFFECPDDPASARRLLGQAERWLAERGCRECYGPVAGSARDRIGLLTEGFDEAALVFTPYNPRWYRGLLEAAGYAPRIRLRAYGWSPAYQDRLGVIEGGRRTERDATIRIRSIRPERLEEETRLIASLINETMAEAWHYDPIDEREADAMARLLRPILDPRVALVAEDSAGPCGVALSLPDVNWLWRMAGGHLWPTGWLRLFRHRRRIPAARMMALGVSRRIRGSSLALRLIGQLHAAGVAAGYTRGELAQVFDDNQPMRRILERMGFPVVRRYAVFHRVLEP